MDTTPKTKSREAPAEEMNSISPSPVTQAIARVFDGRFRLDRTLKVSQQITTFFGTDVTSGIDAGPE